MMVIAGRAIKMLANTTQGETEMTGLENAQHDLTDAQFSLETAIELLDSIDHDGFTVPQQLHGVIAHLRTIKTELDMSFNQLLELQQQETH
jgi:hypothetical protein